MSKIENMTISVSKGVAVLIGVCSLLITAFTVYFAAMNGVRDGFDKVNNRINGNEKTYELRFQAIENGTESLKDDLADLQRIVMTYREATKPEETEVKQRN